MRYEEKLEDILRSSLSDLEAVPDITDAVMSQIHAERPGRRRRFVWMSGMGSVAAAASLLALIVAKPGGVERPSGKPHVMTQPQRTISVPSGPIQPKKQEASSGVRVAFGQRATVDRRPSLKDTSKPHRPKRAQRKDEPAQTSPDPTLRMEFCVAGGSRNVVVAVGPVEHIVRADLQNKVTATPPDPEAPTIKRPPLQTVVSADPAVLLISNI